MELRVVVKTLIALDNQASHFRTIVKAVLHYTFWIYTCNKYNH